MKRLLAWLKPKPKKPTAAQVYLDWKLRQLEKEFGKEFMVRTLAKIGYDENGKRKT